MQHAIGIGVFLQFSRNRIEFNLRIQASNSVAASPLQAEAKALLLAAIVVNHLGLHRPTFLTDNKVLATAAADRRSSLRRLNWDIRTTVSEFFQVSAAMEPNIFHISRDINGVAHNCAKQALRDNQASPSFSCTNSSHGVHLCPIVARLQDLASQGFVIYGVLCY